MDATENKASQFYTLWQKNKIKYDAPHVLRIIFSKSLLQKFGIFHIQPFGGTNVIQDQLFEDTKVTGLVTRYAVSNYFEDEFLSELEYEKSETVAIVPLLAEYNTTHYEFDSRKSTAQTRQYDADTQSEKTLTSLLFTTKASDQATYNFKQQASTLFKVRSPRSRPGFVNVVVEGDIIPPTVLSTNQTINLLGTFPL